LHNNDIQFLRKNAMTVAENTALTRQELSEYMQTLKRTLLWFELHYSRNLVFFDKQSMYWHMRNVVLSPPDNFCGKKRFQRKPPADLGELLDIIEPYIPIQLTEDNFNFFMDAVTDSYRDAVDLPDAFTHKAKQDFVAKLRAFTHPSEWQQVMMVCESIRFIKEQLE
jgi:hypothetical protein